MKDDNHEWAPECRSEEDGVIEGSSPTIGVGESTLIDELKEWWIENLEVFPSGLVFSQFEKVVSTNSY